MATERHFEVRTANSGLIQSVCNDYIENHELFSVVSVHTAVGLADGDEEEQTGNLSYSNTSMAG